MSEQQSVKKIRNNPKTPRIYEPVANVWELCAHIAGHDGRQLFLWKDPISGEDRSMTYGELHDRIFAVAAAIDHAGLRGSRIAVTGPNSPMWIASYLGILAADSIAVPMDKDIADNEMEGFLKIVDAEAVFFDTSMVEKITGIAANCEKIKHLIMMQNDTLPENAPAVMTTFDAWVEAGRAQIEAGYTYPEVTDTRKMAEMLFTSGTTGTSKCVMLCQENIFSVVTCACETVDFSKDDLIISLLPLHHTYELACTMAGMNYGMTIAINDSLKNVVANFKKYRPTALVLVPLYVETFHRRIWAKARSSGQEKKLQTGMKISNALLRAHIDLRKKIFSQVVETMGGRLKKIICGGAALNKELIYEFESFGISIYEGFGITECAPLVAVTPYYDRKPGSIGPAVPCCEIRIGGDVSENDKGLPEGEIQVRGSNVMLGYYQNEEATAEAFTEDGWFRTGDIGTMDKDGYITITGRLKSVIVLENGKNVFPEEIEEHLGLIEEISECVVIGRKDKRTGNIVLTALIYPDLAQFRGKDAAEIKTFFKGKIEEINRDLVSYKRVQKIEIVEEPFEKTTSRKIKRHLIK